MRGHGLALRLGVIAGLGLVAAAVLVWVGQPRVAWRLRPADNRLGLHLAPGPGPLAGWVLHLDQLELPGMTRPQTRAGRQLRPGERIRLPVRITGPLGRTVVVSLRVPAAPALRVSRLTARTLRLGFDRALARAEAEYGPGPGRPVAARGTAVLLARTARVRTVRLEVVAEDGERAAVDVTVPALAPIAWRVGPVRLAGRRPLAVTFAAPVRWVAGRAPMTLVPKVAGRWRSMGSAGVRFVPAGPWPPGSRLVVRPAPEGVTGADGAQLVGRPETLRLPVRRRRTPARLRTGRTAVPDAGGPTAAGAPPGPRTGADGPPAPPSGSTLPVDSFGNPSGGRIYLTIDDGWFPNDGVLQLMRADHLPITTFLIVDAAQEDLPFWRAFQAAGGVIEDHTVIHPDLARLRPHAAFLQWAVNRDRFRQWFGAAPTLGRPPYGDVSSSVLETAREAGLRALVLWSATDTNGTIATWNGQPLAAGEIVLLHWDPGVAGELRSLVKVIRARHLTPAPLLAGLG